MAVLLARLLCACLLALAACGGPDADSTATPVLGGDAGEARDDEDTAAGEDPGFAAFATKNTTRINAPDATILAAAAAQAVFPGRTPDQKPRAVALVRAGDWRAAVSAAQLMARPVRAPLLYAEQGGLPGPSQEALARLDPPGAEPLGDAQVIRVGDVARPEGLRSADVAAGRPEQIAQRIDELVTRAAGKPSPAVLVAALDAPGYAMPAAAWAARSGDPVLWVQRDSVPAATKAALRAHGKPRIYVLGPPAVVADEVLEALEPFGTVRRIGAEGPSASSVAFARYSEGRFGWGVVQPGHGVVFANAARPADAGAVAPLSGAGTYGPLVVLEQPGSLATVVREWLLDIQPGYDRDPVQGVYNHGWLAGDEEAISLDVQSRIDALLEIQPIDPEVLQG